VAIWAVGIGGGRVFAADPAQEAEKLLRHGVELRRLHNDEGAAREFQKAYDLVRSPRAAAQLGLAKQALGLWEEAERYVGEAVRAAGDAWVAKNRGALDEALGTIQKHLGRIEVIGDPEGADVSVNGRSIGKLPLAGAVRVSAGEVDVDVQAPGYSPAQRTVTLIGGQYQRVVIHLAKVEPGPTTAVPPPVKPGSEPTPAPPEPTPPPARAVGGGPSGARIALKWTAAGLAAAGLAAGVIGVVLHGDNVSKFDDHPCRNKNGVGVLVDGTPDTTCQSLLDSLQTDQKIAIVGFVAAGAFAATWLALMLTEPPSAPRPAEHAAARRLSCAPSVGTIGLSCLGRF